MNWELISELSNTETFAQGSGIRELGRLIETYGGKNWRKCKGFGTVRFVASGETITAELHWYEGHGVGKIEMKIKDLL